MWSLHWVVGLTLYWLSEKSVTIMGLTWWCVMMIQWSRWLQKAWVWQGRQWVFIKVGELPNWGFMVQWRKSIASTAWASWHTWKEGLRHGSDERRESLRCKPVSCMGTRLWGEGGRLGVSAWVLVSGYICMGVCVEVCAGSCCRAAGGIAGRTSSLADARRCLDGSWKFPVSGPFPVSSVGCSGSNGSTTATSES